MFEPDRKKREAIKREYEVSADQYDEDWSYYVEATTRETLKRLPMESGDSLLDVGCGTGALLKRLRERQSWRRLVGVDLSTGMLKQAHGGTENIASLAAAGAEALPFASRQFDLVVSCNAFHFFLDPTRFLSEAKRLLKPGGTIVISDWCDDYWACWFCDYYLRLTNEAHTKVYGSDQITDFLERAGFRDVHCDRYKIDWLWGLMTIRAEARGS